ncbi:MAG: CHC2 zinc finger domain-containing protein, partial [Verrucomicrobiota bacterium]
MPRIKRSSIENLRQRVSLLDVVSPYTQMKRAGAQFRGLSPFNAEKTPSFYIHPEKNVFYDYSSGSAGDLFRFVQLKENIEFYEAIELLADRFSVP